MSNEVQSRREQIAAAFDVEEKEALREEAPEKVEKLPEGSEGKEDPAPEGTVDDGKSQGKEDKVDEYEQEAKAEEQDGGKEHKKPDGSELVTEEDTPRISAQAPRSWKPEAQAAWAKLPDVVRNEVARREVSLEHQLSYSANARKFSDEFTRVVQPYSHLIQAQGSTPLRAVQNLMNTAAGLTTGNPQQKADIVAEIIVNYGLDPEILDTTLAKALQNKGSNVQQQIPPHLMQALKPLFDNAERQKQRERHEQEQMTAQSQQIIDNMSADTKKYPFFEDLREEIADIMEVAAYRGRTMSILDAYKKALRSDDKYSSALQQRSSANNASQAGRTLAAARNRASATKGAPGSASEQKKSGPLSRREQISAAWDEAEQR